MDCVCPCSYPITQRTGWWTGVANPSQWLRSFRNWKSCSRSFSSTVNPDVEVTTIPSGLRVATTHIPGGETATIGVWLDTGSRFETDASNGTAHFVEHMAFKGTKSRTQDSLELEVENMGGHLNAYTSREQTVYFAKVMRQDAGQALDILADILQHSTLDMSAIERERGVILREMQEVESHDEEVVFDQLHAVAYRGTPLARTILGPAENVKQIQQGDLGEYIAARYQPPRMVLAAAGTVSHDDICRTAEQHFSGGSAVESYAGSVEGAIPSVFWPGELRIPTEQPSTLTHIAVAVEGVPVTSDDYFTLAVMQILLGNYDWASHAARYSVSRLGNRLSQFDLAQSVTSFNTCYSDTGLFGFYGITLPDPAIVNKLSSVVVGEWMRLAREVGEDEVAFAGRQLKANILLSLDGTSPVCEDIGRQVLVYGRRMSPAEVCARIDLVTPDHIRAAASRYFCGRAPAVVSLGPSEGLKDLASVEDMRGWMQG